MAYLRSTISWRDGTTFAAIVSGVISFLSSRPLEGIYDMILLVLADLAIA